MGVSVKFLLCKHEDLSLIPQIHWEKTGMVTNACHSSVEDRETGRTRSLLTKHLSLSGELLASETQGRWCCGILLEDVLHSFMLGGIYLMMQRGVAFFHVAFV